MENTDKGRPKIIQMPQNLTAQFVCLSLKVWDFNEKRLHWASVVRGLQLSFKLNFNFKM